MANLTENINQAISDFSSIKQAIIDKGIDVPTGTKTCEYGNLIRNIETEGIKCITDKLAFSLTTAFSDFNTETNLGLPSSYGINLGIAERTIEVVNTCGDSANFIISYGNGDKGQTVALTQTEFVGYYNSVQYCGIEGDINDVSEITGRTRYICFENNDKICKIYVNGIKVVDTELQYSCDPNDEKISLNSFRAQSPITTNSCTTHELKIYNKMLSEDEIKNNMSYYSKKYSLN